MRAFRLGLLAALLVSASPALASDCDPASGVCPPEDLLAQVQQPAVAVASLPDLRPEIKKLENELNTLKHRPVLSAEQNARLRQLPSILSEMKKAEAAVRTAASSASKSELAAAGSAATAVKASAEAQRNNAESKEQATLATAAARDAKTSLATAGTWLLLILAFCAAMAAALLWVVPKLRQLLSRFAIFEAEFIQSRELLQYLKKRVLYDLKLEDSYFLKLKNIPIGAVIPLVVLGENSRGDYVPRHKIELEKISDDQVRCLSGIAGHEGQDMWIAKLPEIVGEAGRHRMLTDQVERLKLVAA